jgi:4,5-dihydroxyphthalate decarboxylase
MADLPLTFGCGLYDRMVPLFAGEVKPSGIDLTFVPGDNPRDVFEGMLDGKFHMAEMSSSDFLRRKSAGQCPFVGIPAFPSRVFRHGMIVVRADAGIVSPQDLEGKRVGVPHYPMTAAVWIRGLLQSDHGVDLTRIRWVQDGPFRAVAGDRSAEELQRRFTIDENTTGKSLETLLDEGELDAFIGADLTEGMRANSRLRRLFPDFAAAERDYYRRTKIFPIMHTVVIRRDVYDANPFVAKSMYDALTRSKDIARQRMRYMGTLRYMLPWMIAEIEELDRLFEGDPFVYGLEPNRHVLETLAGYLADQSLSSGPISLDDAFVDVTS